MAECDSYKGGKCQVCKSGFTLADNACTSVTTAQLITGCVQYNETVPVCVACSAETKPNAAACATVTKLQPNCRQYNATEACLSCEQGYFLNANNACEPLPSPVENCVRFYRAGVC